jgi:hypothetical protein
MSSRKRPVFDWRFHNLFRDHLATVPENDQQIFAVA